MLFGALKLVPSRKLPRLIFYKAADAQEKIDSGQTMPTPNTKGRGNGNQRQSQTKESERFWKKHPNPTCQRHAPRELVVTGVLAGGWRIVRAVGVGSGKWR